MSHQSETMNHQHLLERFYAVNFFSHLKSATFFLLLFDIATWIFILIFLLIKFIQTVNIDVTIVEDLSKILSKKLA